jgi:YD repeat-containing protein
MVLAVQAILTMRIFPVLLALLLLSACVPEYQEPVKITEKIKPELKPAVNDSIRIIPEPFVKVWQKRGDGSVLWGYNEAGNLFLINSSEKTVVIDYEDGKITQIDDGIKPVKFYYSPEGRLLSAEQGIKRWIFTYSSKGSLLSMDNGEKLSFTYDSKGRLSSVKRDNGASTELEYDELNRTKAFYKNRIKADVRYDDEGRLGMIRIQDDYMVVGYWRYSLLSTMSGPMYGMKETVSYGPSSITLVSDSDPQVFDSTYTEIPDYLLDSFNTFLFCNKFKRIPVIFDGQSWVLFHDYLKGDISEYLMKNFICDALP